MQGRAVLLDELGGFHSGLPSLLHPESFEQIVESVKSRDEPTLVRREAGKVI